MKNIHILPTSQQSRLYEFGGEYHLQIKSQENFRSQNIYITSDEEINQQTKPCLCINTIKNTWDADLIYYQGSMPLYHYKGFKKIILTTDQDLIKYGIQAIDDAFLEWFVKNPSREKVEVIYDKDAFPYGVETAKGYGWYKIIIPQEKSKQETLEEAADIERIAMDKLKNKWGHLYTFGYPQRPFPTNYENDLNNIKIGLYEGTKWQQERMYSDMEEYSAFVLKSYKEGLPLLLAKEWFEQFKKK